ncbi:NAD-P-binding protein [Artomyces pyxidatus]|uniref:NAD-P-binding protein n=1 Tax=Artomyces pyxidatus TaxID=48021 RepID=A0ACB8SK50_9AGAM|nr:NAD-P-binding protein [Artomyces pyxidatus]
MAEKRIGILSQFFPPKPTWTAKDVPDLTGKKVIITGGNGGIGKETARILLSKNAKVYLAARSEEKANAAISELKKATGKQDVYFLKLDLADLVTIKAAAAEYTSKESELHILYNNGGIMFPPVEMLTKQGYDAQFGVNVLGHFYLTKLLLPTLLETAKNSPPGTVRVVTLSSAGHNFLAPPEGIKWETLEKGDKSLAARKKLTTDKLYGQSKIANIFFANELARRYGDQGIVSISLHPGGIKTDLARHSGFLARKVGTRMLYDIPFGAITPLYAGTSPEAAKLNGKYLTAWARVTLPNEKAINPQLESKLWEWSEEQVRDI